MATITAASFLAAKFSAGDPLLSDQGRLARKPASPSWGRVLVEALVESRMRAARRELRLRRLMVDETGPVLGDQRDRRAMLPFATN